MNKSPINKMVEKSILIPISKSLRCWFFQLMFQLYLTLSDSFLSFVIFDFEFVTFGTLFVGILPGRDQRQIPQRIGICFYQDWVGDTTNLELP